VSPTTESESSGVTVRILDKDYQFGCHPQEKEGLLASARFLDERMREVRKSGRVIGTDRIAVVAAINLAYDLLQKGREDAGLGHATVKRLATLQGRIDAALANPPASAGA
jgi:cell division protein ZapA